MITEIGIIAGKTLELLEENNGTLILGEIHADLKQPRDLVLMSLGWLINENYIHIIEDPSTSACWANNRTRMWMNASDISDLVIGNETAAAPAKQTKAILDRLRSVTGKILILLEGCGGSLDLKGLEHNINEDRDIVLMGLGWLVRKGHVQGIAGNHEIMLFSILLSITPSYN